MIVRDIKKILGTNRDASGPGWVSRRLLVRSDGMGYSMNDTMISAGAEMTLEYKNHFEACYCISGKGEIVDHATGEKHAIYPGVIYALNNNDKHTLRCSSDGDMHLVCVFNPALEGTEVHGPDGSYS